MLCKYVVCHTTDQATCSRSFAATCETNIGTFFIRVGFGGRLYSIYIYIYIIRNPQKIVLVIIKAPILHAKLRVL